MAPVCELNAKSRSPVDEYSVFEAGSTARLDAEEGNVARDVTAPVAGSTRNNSEVNVRPSTVVNVTPNSWCVAGSKARAAGIRVRAGLVVTLPVSGAAGEILTHRGGPPLAPAP